MAYEILNNAQVTPHRLHALLRLAARETKAARQDLLDLLQPGALQSESSEAKQSASKAVFNAAVNCGLITQGSGNSGPVQLLVSREEIESSASFRACMQRTLLGVRDENRPNYLLNLYAAWYAVQNERVLQFAPQDFETNFNQEIQADAEERVFNKTKLSGWEQWAAFVGWGWFLKTAPTRTVLVPDAYSRIAGTLPAIFAADGRGKSLEFGVFARRLGEYCPELDGGLLFERCWQGSRGAEPRGNRLSLMLSTALRVLHDTEFIELERRADATDIWQLFPAEGHGLKQATHIRLRSR